MTQKFYLRDTALNPFPTAGEKSTTEPVGTQTYGLTPTDKDLSGTKGTTATSAATTLPNSTTANNGTLGRWTSARLAAGTYGSGSWTIALQTAESDANYNVFLRSASLYFWRPSTSSVVGFVIDSNTQTGVEFGNAVAAARYGQVVTWTGSNVTIQDGDVLVFELWTGGTPSMAGASRTATIYYDGTTDVTAAYSGTDPASYINAPADIPLSPSATTSFATVVATVTDLDVGGGASATPQVVTPTTSPVALVGVGQIRALLTFGNTANQTTYTTGTVTPTAGALVLAFFALSGASSAPSTWTPPTLTGAGMTWEIVRLSNQAGFLGTWCFRAQSATPGSGALTIDLQGNTAARCGWQIVEVTGLTNYGDNGASLIAQTAVAGASGTSGSTTFPAAFTDAAHLTICHTNRVATDAITPDPNLTTIATNIVETSRYQTDWRAGEEATVDWSASASSNWTTLALEVGEPVPVFATVVPVVATVTSNTLTAGTGATAVVGTTGVVVLSSVLSASGGGVGTLVTTTPIATVNVLTATGSRTVAVVTVTVVATVNVLTAIGTSGGTGVPTTVVVSATSNVLGAFATYPDASTSFTTVVVTTTRNTLGGGITTSLTTLVRPFTSNTLTASSGATGTIVTTTPTAFPQTLGATAGASATVVTVVRSFTINALTATVGVVRAVVTVTPVVVPQTLRGGAGGRLVSVPVVVHVSLMASGTTILPTPGGSTHPAWGGGITLHAQACIGTGTPWTMGPHALDALDAGNVMGPIGVDGELCVEVACDICELTVVDGATKASGIFSRDEAATLDLVLYDPDRIYDPLNSESPYWIQGRTRLTAGVPLEIWAEVPDDLGVGVVRFDLFRGSVDRWTSEIHASAGDRRARVTATGPVKQMANRNYAELPSAVGAGDTTAQRLARLRSYFDWVPPLEQIGTASSVTLQATTLAQSFWEHLGRTIDDELGYLHVLPDGTIRYWTRTVWTDPAPAPSLVLGCSDDYPSAWDVVTNTRLAATDEQLRNAVYAARTGGTQQTARSETSIAQHGGIETRLNRTDLGLQDDVQVGTWANTVILLYAFPSPTLDGLTMQPGLIPDPSGDYWRAVLGLEHVSDTFRFVWSEDVDGSAPVDLLLRVLGVKHEITPEAWDVTWQTLGASIGGASNVWHIGPHALDALDSGNVIGAQ